MSIANPFLENTNLSEEDQKLRKHASYASVALASSLIIIKFFAYLLTDSVSLLSSLLDSTIDVMASIVTLISIRHAIEPADDKHRYGHGKVESLSAVGQAILILASGIFLFYAAIHRMVHPLPIQSTSLGIAVMVISILLTVVLVLYQKHVVKKTGSIAIDADSLHYKGDLLMNLGVIAALILTTLTQWPYFDPIFALLITIILFFSASIIFKKSFGVLMDKEIPLSQREKIFNIILKHPKVDHVHDLRTRTSGQALFIEFHLEMDGKMSLKKAHDVTEEIEFLLFNEFHNAEILIHQEPTGLDHEKLDDRLEDSP